MTRRTGIVVTAVLSVVLAVLLLVFVLQLASSPDARLSLLGDDVFVVGEAAPLASESDERGPLGFKDPLGRGRDIWLQHIGGRRWRAFEERIGGRCRFELDRAAAALRNSCTAEVLDVADPLPAGVRSYPARVDRDGDLVVDLRG